jgi:hypothetical protein
MNCSFISLPGEPDQFFLFVRFYCSSKCLFVHFLLAQKTNQKRAASDLFWDYHFLAYPRITTRGPALHAGSFAKIAHRAIFLRSAPSNSNAYFNPSLRSLQNANLFPKNI